MEIKQFKAVSDSICIAQFKVKIEDGWYATTKEALMNFKNGDNVLDTVNSRSETINDIAEPKRKGRPRKELSHVDSSDAY